MGSNQFVDVSVDVDDLSRHILYGQSRVVWRRFKTFRFRMVGNFITSKTMAYSRVIPITEMRCLFFLG